MKFFYRESRHDGIPVQHVSWEAEDGQELTVEEALIVTLNLIRYQLDEIKIEIKDIS